MKVVNRAEVERFLQAVDSVSLILTKMVGHATLDMSRKQWLIAQSAVNVMMAEGALFNQAALQSQFREEDRIPGEGGTNG